MDKNRLEMFSDGVLAIIITIMVLEINGHVGAELSNLRPLLPAFFSYILSFLYVGIYWKNHYHLMQSISKINGPILWSNLHFLFWLSLVPISTKWMGVHSFAKTSISFYGAILFFCSISFYILQKCIIANEGKESRIAAAVGKDTKGKLSFMLYFVAIFCSFYSQWISISIYISVLVIWLARDKKIEKKINSDKK
jgi:uncharacterized membrane protein